MAYQHRELGPGEEGEGGLTDDNSQSEGALSDLGALARLRSCDRRERVVSACRGARLARGEDVSIGERSPLHPAVPSLAFSRRYGTARERIESVPGRWGVLWRVRTYL